MTTIVERFPSARLETREWRLHLPSLLAGILVFAVLIEPLQVGALPTGAVEASYTALVALYMGGLILRGRCTRLELFSLILIFFVVGHGIILTGSPLVASAGALWILKPVLAFLAGVFLAGPRTERVATEIALAGCLVLSGAVIAEALGAAWLNTSKGLSGVYVGAAQAGHAGVLGLLLLQARPTRRGALWWLVAAFLLSSVLLTGSRHSLLLAALAILPFAGMRRIMHGRWLAKFVLVAIMLGVGIATVGHRTVARFNEIEEIVEGREYYRLHALRVGFAAGRENLGFGVGPGRFGGPVAYRFVGDATYQRELTRFWVWKNAAGRPTTTDVAAAHVIGELGYAGFGLLMAWGIWLALRSRGGTRSGGVSAPRSLLVVAIASLLTFAPITNGPLQLVFFVLATGRRSA